MTFIFTVPSLQLRWQTSDLHTTEKQNKKKILDIAIKNDIGRPQNVLCLHVIYRY